MTETVRIRSFDEVEVVVNGLLVRVAQCERLTIDHAQRFDTLQTPLWKRIVFWLDGWPWHDLNAERAAWRPWRRWWHS